ncbi:hypothetical protein EDC01DRAFT_636190 [Geopyxis carbonaria]|nr:hypothetical protein EDC01DRAFT_636190 [Geopyxis carbonaria]
MNNAGQQTPTPPYTPPTPLPRPASPSPPVLSPPPPPSAPPVLSPPPPPSAPPVLSPPPPPSPPPVLSPPPPPSPALVLSPPLPPSPSPRSSMPPPPPPPPCGIPVHVPLSARLPILTPSELEPHATLLDAIINTCALRTRDLAHVRASRSRNMAYAFIAEEERRAHAELLVIEEAMAEMEEEDEEDGEQGGEEKEEKWRRVRAQLAMKRGMIPGLPLRPAERVRRPGPR